MLCWKEALLEQRERGMEASKLVVGDGFEKSPTDGKKDDPGNLSITGQNPQHLTITRLLIKHHLADTHIGGNHCEIKSLLLRESQVKTVLT